MKPSINKLFNEADHCGWFRYSKEYNIAYRLLERYEYDFVNMKGQSIIIRPTTKFVSRKNWLSITIIQTIS